MAKSERNHDGDFVQDVNTKGGGWEDSGSLYRDCINLKKCVGQKADGSMTDLALFTKIPYVEDKEWD